MQASGDHAAARSDSRSTLTVIDNRTGRQYELPISDNTIRATDLRQIKTGAGDFGLMTYDPAFMNTASCRSAITYIDGDRGILRYRGYPIEQLAERCSYLETAFLLIHGNLPSPAQLDSWSNSIMQHSTVFGNVRKLIEGFPPDAHPMAMFISTVASLSTFYRSSGNLADLGERELTISRLIGKGPTLAAYAYRHKTGKPYVAPDEEMSYSGNFLSMMFRPEQPGYRPDPLLVRALDILFILQADHEQNCSTSVVRGVGSSRVDPYSAMAGAATALYGPLHGGANEAVLRMLDEIDNVAKVPGFIAEVKAGKRKLMGFGHRVYKNFDPRASIIKKLADQVFEVTGRNLKLDIALELERIALADDYFISRKLYPNVDFYSGLIYQALKFPTDFFPVLFAIGRMSGWLAQWLEMIQDPEQKIYRPRQIYTGIDQRTVPPERQ
jgi:citrate synthase